MLRNIGLSSAIPVMGYFGLALISKRVKTKRLAHLWIGSCEKHNQREHYAGFKPTVCGETIATGAFIQPLPKNIRKWYL